MSMAMPIVSGILATDLNESITALNDDGKEVVIGQMAPKATRSLDFAVLGKYLQSLRKLNTLLVVGENTFNDMQNAGLFERHNISLTNIIISTPERAYVAEQRYSAVHEFSTDSPKDELCAYAFEHAIKTNRSMIGVLGGRSVYEAFAGHYSELYHCQFKFKAEPGKRVSVRESSPYAHVRKEGSLVDPAITPLVYMDNSLYTIKHYVM